MWVTYFQMPTGWLNRELNKCDDDDQCNALSAVILIDTDLCIALHSVQVMEPIFKFAPFSPGHDAQKEEVNFHFLNALFLTMLYILDTQVHLKRWHRITIIESNSDSLTTNPASPFTCKRNAISAYTLHSSAVEPDETKCWPF